MSPMSTPTSLMNCPLFMNKTLCFNAYQNSFTKLFFLEIPQPLRIKLKYNPFTCYADWIRYFEQIKCNVLEYFYVSSD